jgi:hypothetical protein
LLGKKNKAPPMSETVTRATLAVIPVILLLNPPFVRLLGTLIGKWKRTRSWVGGPKDGFVARSSGRLTSDAWWSQWPRARGGLLLLLLLLVFAAELLVMNVYVG